MHNSFTSKFFLIHTFITFFLFFVLLAIFSSMISSHFIKERQQVMINESIILNQKIDQSLLTSQMKSISFLYHFSIISRTINVRTLILDLDSVILLDSAKEDTNIEGYSLVTPIISKTFKTGPQKDVCTLDAFYSEDVLITTYPIYNNYSFKGVIVMITPLSSFKEGANKFYHLLFASLMFFLLITYLSTYIFFRHIHNVLSDLNTSVLRITGGDFTTEIASSNTGGDIGQLSTNINHMASELSKSEQMRKDFISNISHDFLSPLTSISGFIQAILDGTIPHEKENKYLQIILDEAKHLTKLTNDILLLGKIEGDIIQIHKSQFDINEMLKMVLEQFEQIITKKNIIITLLFSQEEIFVYADINQIRRVLTNLIGNATKFCHKNDSIVLETSIDYKSVKIRIEDSGPGISPDNIPYIWDRFHKADHSRGKDKGGNGLGLSIVREIIKSHDEEIFVYSKEGEGTSFIFTLPLS